MSRDVYNVHIMLSYSVPVTGSLQVMQSNRHAGSLFFSQNSLKIGRESNSLVAV